MSSLVTTWKKNTPDLSWGRSARVEGKPRLVEQISRGPRERGLEQLRTQGSVAPQPGAAPPLQTVQPREGGASTLCEALAQDLGLIERINAHVPPAPARRRTSLSVGHALVLAAINRILWPTSTRAFAEWYEGTVLARLVPAAAEALSRQRFWEHRPLCEAHHFAPIPRELLTRIRERFPVGEQCFVSETTHASTVLHPCNSRPSLPQRGRQKPKRHALRQLSLAVVVEEERGLPLASRCAEGTVTEVVALGARLSGMIRHGLLPQAPARFAVVLDQGNVSWANVTILPQAQVAFRAAVPAGWVRALFQVALRASQPLALAQGRRGQVDTQSEARLGGIDGTRLVRVRPTFSRTQVRTLDLRQPQADQTRHAVRASLQEAVVRKRPRKERAVRRERTLLVRHDRLNDCGSPTLHGDPGAVTALPWEWDRRNKRQGTHRDFGKTVLCTDRQELSAHRMVVAYRHQAKVEDLVRLSTSRRPGLWWPAHHWTDSTLSVHALSCFVALRLLRIVLLRLQDRHLAIGVGLLTERLRGIEEALVVSANGAAQRVITARSPEQEELFVALDVRTLAEQLGHTGLNP
jgi:transposase